MSSGGSYSPASAPAATPLRLRPEAAPLETVGQVRQAQCRGHRRIRAVLNGTAQKLCRALCLRQPHPPTNSENTSFRPESTYNCHRLHDRMTLILATEIWSACAMT